MPKFRKILSDLNPLTLPAEQRNWKIGFYTIGAGCITYASVEQMFPVAIAGVGSIAFGIADTLQDRKRYRSDTD